MILEPCGKELALPTAFGDWLASERQKRGLGTRTLADKAGVSHATISKIEDGLQGASKEMVRKLADGLGVSLSEAMTAWVKDELPEARIVYDGNADDTEGRIVRFVSPEEAELLDGYSGLPEPLQRTHLENIMQTAAALRKRTRGENERFTSRADEDENPARLPDEFAE